MVDRRALALNCREKAQNARQKAWLERRNHKVQRFGNVLVRGWSGGVVEWWSGLTRPSAKALAGQAGARSKGLECGGLPPLCSRHPSSPGLPRTGVVPDPKPGPKLAVSILTTFFT
jgi:hypothetical protein